MSKEVLPDTAASVLLQQAEHLRLSENSVAEPSFPHLGYMIAWFYSAVSRELNQHPTDIFGDSAQRSVANLTTAIETIKYHQETVQSKPTVRDVELLLDTQLAEIYATSATAAQEAAKIISRKISSHPCLAFIFFEQRHTSANLSSFRFEAQPREGQDDRNHLVVTYEYSQSNGLTIKMQRPLSNQLNDEVLSILKSMGFSHLATQIPPYTGSRMIELAFPPDSEQYLPLVQELEAVANSILEKKRLTRAEDFSDTWQEPQFSVEHTPMLTCIEQLIQANHIRLEPTTHSLLVEAVKNSSKRHHSAAESTSEHTRDMIATLAEAIPLHILLYTLLTITAEGVSAYHTLYKEYYREALSWDDFLSLGVVSYILVVGYHYILKDHNRSLKQ